MVEVAKGDFRPESGEGMQMMEELFTTQPQVLPGSCEALLHKSHLCFGASANPPGMRHEVGFGTLALAVPCHVSGAPSGTSTWEAGALG